MTAQLECLLDDVLVGRQKMMGAIDAVCVAAARIIERLTSASEVIATPLLGRRRFSTEWRAASDAGDEAVCRQHRQAEGHQAAARLYEIRIHVPGFPRPARIEKSGQRCVWRNRHGAASDGSDSPRPKDGTRACRRGTRHRCRSQLQVLPARFPPPEATSQHAQRESDIRRPQDLPNTTTGCAYRAKLTATPWNRDAAAHPLWQ